MKHKEEFAKPRYIGLPLSTATKLEEKDVEGSYGQRGEGLRNQSNEER